jgi:holin-like protein
MILSWMTWNSRAMNNRYTQISWKDILALSVAAALIVVCLAVGDQLSNMLARVHFPVPGSVIGMLLLFGCLSSGLVPVSHVEKLADWLIRNLGLFFVPAGVGLVQYRNEIGQFWLAIVVAIIASTFLVLATTGVVAYSSAKKSADHGKRDHHSVL